MSAVDREKALESRFQVNWDKSLIPIHYQNVEFDPTNLDNWVRFNVLDGDTTIAGFGGIADSLHRSVGVISIECAARPGEGTRKLLQVAEDAAAIFRLKTFDGVICGPASIVKQGFQDGWYKVNVYISFRFDETYSVIEG